METIKELLNAKFTHMSAKIEAQGTLLEEKINHNREYIGGRLDEVIRRQKIANGDVKDLKEEAETCKAYREVASIIPFWKKIPLFVVIPIIFTIMGLSVRSFIDLENVKDHKVDKEMYRDERNDILLIIERKTQAQESLAKTNKQDIVHIEQYLQEIKEAQDQIDILLYEKFRVRGSNDMLPEF